MYKPNKIFFKEKDLVKVYFKNSLIFLRKSKSDVRAWGPRGIFLIGTLFLHQFGTVWVSEAFVKGPDVVFCALFENEGPGA